MYASARGRPESRNVSPTSPASPAGRSASPTSRPASPTSRSASPAGRSASPASPAGRSASPAGLSKVVKRTIMQPNSYSTSSEEFTDEDYSVLITVKTPDKVEQVRVSGPKALVGDLLCDIYMGVSYTRKAFPGVICLVSGQLSGNDYNKTIMVGKTTKIVLNYSSNMEMLVEHLTSLQLFTEKKKALYVIHKTCGKLLSYIGKVNLGRDMKEYVHTLTKAVNNKWSDRKVRKWNKANTFTVVVSFYLFGVKDSIIIDINTLEDNTYWSLLDRVSNMLSEQTAYPKLFFLLLPLMTDNLDGEEAHINLRNTIEPTASLHIGNDVTAYSTLMWTNSLLKFLEKDSLLFKRVHLARIIFKQVQNNTVAYHAILIKIAKAVEDIVSVAPKKLAKKQRHTSTASDESSTE